MHGHKSRIVNTVVKSTKVVICGSYGLGNPGDEAILSCMMRALKVFPRQIDFVVLSFDPSHTSKLHGVKAIPILSLRIADKVSLLRKSHLFILGGGGLIQDYSSMLNLPLWVSNLKLAHAMGTPTMLYAVGVEPIRFASCRTNVARALGQASVITVRDENSAKLLKSWGTRNEVLVTADPAWGMKNLAYHGPEYSCEQAGKESRDEPLVGISLRQWLDLDSSIYRYIFPFKHDPRLWRFSANLKAERFLNAMASVADALVERVNARIVVLPFWQKADRATCISFIDRVRHRERVELVRDQYSGLQLIALMRNMDAFIGMRMHSLLFAAISGTPFIALGYSPKVKAFMSQLGQLPEGIEDPSITVNDLERVESLDNLVDAVVRLIEKRDEIGRTLERKSTALAARSERSAFEAFDLLTTTLSRAKE